MATVDEESKGEFESWYVLAWPRLVGALTAVLGDIEVAKDAASEAVARAYERWETVSAMRSPSGWAYQVGLNVGRRRARRAALELRLLRSHPEASAPPATLSPELWAAVRALPTRQRTAVALRYVLDLSQVEIAGLMGVTTGTVAASLHAARQRLATVLSDAEERVPHG